MNEIIYCGLKLTANKGSKYYQVKEGCVASIYEDPNTSCLVLTYPSGSTSETIGNTLGVETVGKSMKILPTGTTPRRFQNITFSLNGLTFRRVTADTHTIHIVIVGDSESRVSQTYNGTTIVVSQEDAANPDFINYLFFSGNLQYIKPIGPKPSGWRIYNFPRITITDQSKSLESNSTTVYYLRRRYDDYVIRAIDYQDSFIAEIRNLLEAYGLELVRQNKEMSLKKTSHVVYQFLQTPVKYNHVKYNDIDSRVHQHRLPVEFTLRSTDMVMYFDFKNKYNNLDFITNFCEFKTTDKYGQRWTASVRWGQITEDFNHTYQQDDNANFSYQCQFRAELYFYEVQDDRFEFLTEILTSLESED